MAEPPLFGVDQLKLICEEDTAVAVSPVGGDGATARVVAEPVPEGGLVPTELMAETLYVYVVPAASPVSEYVVEVPPEFDTIVVQMEPPLADLSIMYPAMAEPPLSAGAVQLKLIWEEDTAVAASALGGDGAIARVVADALPEGGLVPMALIAETL